MMKLIAVQDARNRWASCLESVINENAVFGLTYWQTRRGELVEGRADPAAVLLSPERWQRGVDRVAVPSTMRLEIAAREARAQLRNLREDAARGIHTIISRWGKEQAVLAPYAWALQAMPEVAKGPQQR